MRRIRLAAGAAAAAVALAALTACSAPAAAPTAHAAHAGSYPVAVAGADVTRTQSVSAGGYALVAAGDPVRVHLQGADLLVTVAGPDVDVPQPKPGEPISAPSAPGVLTVTAAATRGSARLASDQFLGLNEEQSKFVLGTDRRSGVVRPGHPVTLHLHARFASGHTTLTWQPLGKPLITWDFTIEID
ncbi:hypothetical protein [Amnibacterium setariae]|uniref:Uncharacterized protein n=1 Tax=Amnibacterium setariae TaxID=2306585 RepID=A0A3A1U987_9MICO|nr:hypothetical protein [Amnibacterium setariae]RIX30809.1 hypothetical protein D1781_05275 [Amnibacterium setariae]